MICLPLSLNSAPQNNAYRIELERGPWRIPVIGNADGRLHPLSKITQLLLQNKSEQASEKLAQLLAADPLRLWQSFEPLSGRAWETIPPAYEILGQWCTQVHKQGLKVPALDEQMWEIELNPRPSTHPLYWHPNWQKSWQKACEEDLESGKLHELERLINCPNGRALDLPIFKTQLQRITRLALKAPQSSSKRQSGPQINPNSKWVYLSSLELSSQTDFQACPPVTDSLLLKVRTRQKQSSLPTLRELGGHLYLPTASRMLCWPLASLKQNFKRPSLRAISAGAQAMDLSLLNATQVQGNKLIFWQGSFSNSSPIMLPSSSEEIGQLSHLRIYQSHDSAIVETSPWNKFFEESGSNYCALPIIRENRIYLLECKGWSELRWTLSCLDYNTQKLLWKSLLLAKENPWQSAADLRSLLPAGKLLWWRNELIADTGVGSLHFIEPSKGEIRELMLTEQHAHDSLPFERVLSVDRRKFRLLPQSKRSKELQHLDMGKLLLYKPVRSSSLLALKGGKQKKLDWAHGFLSEDSALLGLGAEQNAVWLVDYSMGAGKRHIELRLLDLQNGHLRKLYRLMISRSTDKKNERKLSPLVTGPAWLHISPSGEESFHLPTVNGLESWKLSTPESSPTVLHDSAVGAAIYTNALPATSLVKWPQTPLGLRPIVGGKLQRVTADLWMLLEGGGQSPDASGPRVSLLQLKNPPPHTNKR